MSWWEPDSASYLVATLSSTQAGTGDLQNNYTFVCLARLTWPTDIHCGVLLTTSTCLPLNRRRVKKPLLRKSSKSFLGTTHAVNAFSTFLNPEELMFIDSEMLTSLDTKDDWTELLE